LCRPAIKYTIETGGIFIDTKYTQIRKTSGGYPHWPVDSLCMEKDPQYHEGMK